MGRRPVQNKKAPSEYPQMGFRVTKSDKDRLNSLIDEVQELLNRRRRDDEPFINKNDVIIRALDEGLKVIRKK